MQQRVYEKRVNDVDELCQRLLSVWHSIGQNVIDEAIVSGVRDSPPVYEQKWVILSTWCKIDLIWMLVLWLDILSQFWIEYDLVVYLHT